MSTVFAKDTTTKIKMSELRLADTVRSPFIQPYNIMTVKQIENGQVTFFRPYVHTSDFAHTGGVICYIGIEEFTTPIRDDFEYELLERKELT